MTEYFRQRLYCNSCERWVAVCSWEGFHIVTNPNVKGDICYGFFTTSALPELEEDWELYLSEPTSDEIEVMKSK